MHGVAPARHDDDVPGHEQRDQPDDPPAQRQPVGERPRDRDRGHVIRDLKHDGDQVVVAKGGRGGHGNLYAIVRIDVPSSLTARERELFEELARVSRFNPRATVGKESAHESRHA